MSDEQSPYTPMAAPPAVPPRLPDDDGRGTLGRGIAQFFACVFVGGILAFVLGTAIFHALAALFGSGANEASGVGAVIVIGLPWLAALAIGIWHAAQGRTRTALGMLVGFGILVGAVVLLVAACFGILGGLRMG